MNHLILLISTISSFQPEWIINETGIFERIVPWEIAVSPDDQVFLLTKDAPFIHQYEKSGKRLRSFAEEGKGPNAMENPFQIFFENEVIYINENNYIQLFSADGEFVNKIATPHGHYVAHKIKGGWITNTYLNPQDPIQRFAFWDNNFEKAKVFFELEKPYPKPGERFQPYAPRTQFQVSPDGSTIFFHPEKTLKVYVYQALSQEIVNIISVDSNRIPLTQKHKDAYLQQITRLPSLRKYTPVFPEFLPEIASMLALPDEKFRISRPTKELFKEEYLFYDAKGNMTKPGLDVDILDHIKLIKGNWAYVSPWHENMEEAILAKVALKDVEAFVASYLAEVSSK